MDWVDVLENPRNYRGDEYRVYRSDQSSRVIRTPEGVAKHFFPDGSEPISYEFRSVLNLREPDLSPSGKIARYQSLSGVEGDRYMFPEVYETADPDLEGRAILMEDLNGNLFSQLTHEERINYGEELGKSIREMHSDGITIRDWTASNIVVTPESSKFGFIDLGISTVNCGLLERFFDRIGHHNKNKLPSDEISTGYRTYL